MPKKKPEINEWTTDECATDGCKGIRMMYSNVCSKCYFVISGTLSELLETSGENYVTQTEGFPRQWKKKIGFD